MCIRDRDNADIRLTEKAYNLGLAREERLKKMEEKVAKSTELEEFLRETSLKPSVINPILEANESSLVDQAYRAAQILTRPNITLDKLSEIDFIKEKADEYNEEQKEQAEINIKYKGYIEKERAVSYTHLDVYKRQAEEWANQKHTELQNNW